MNNITVLILYKCVVEYHNIRLDRIVSNMIYFMVQDFAKLNLILIKLLVNFTTLAIKFYNQMSLEQRKI